MDYINQIISLSKKSPQDPFTLQYKMLDGIDLYEDYLPDGKIWLKDMRYNGTPLLQPNEDMMKVLEIIFNSIERYPWTWDLNGTKLDLYGFDIYLQGNDIRFSPAALRTVQEHIGYVPEATLERIYSQPNFAYAPHLTKLSIELEKTSVISQFTIQLHSIHPVRVAGFIYESSLSGEGHPMELNLEELKVKQSNESLIISFGEPIVVKRITLTLAQDNLSEVVAVPKDNPLDKLFTVKYLLDKYIEIERGTYRG